MPEDPSHVAPVARLEQLVNTTGLSTYRENLLQQLLAVELIQSCCLLGLPPVDLAYAAVDFSGYDIVATCGAITRHIQLKATKSGAVGLHRALSSKSSGCCVLMKPTIRHGAEAPPRISMTYRFLGGPPGDPLELNTAWPEAQATRYSRTEDGGYARPSRTNHVAVPRSAFGPPVDIDVLAVALFGSPLQG